MSLARVPPILPPWHAHIHRAIENTSVLPVTLSQ